MFIKVVRAHCSVIYVTFKLPPCKNIEMLLKCSFDNFLIQHSCFKYMFQKTSNGPFYNCKQLVFITKTLGVKLFIMITPNNTLNKLRLFLL